MSKEKYAWSQVMPELSIRGAGQEDRSSGNENEFDALKFSLWLALWFNL